MIKYHVPTRWISYDIHQILQPLTEAKASMLALMGIPHQKSWLDELQIIQLKREVAGTSRIEGAEFTERELDNALKESPQELLTRSQRQAHAAMLTYTWLSTVPAERPIDGDFIREIHARIVRGADDDHCPPGELRKRDQNVNFGIPRHRGAEGGDECAKCFHDLCQAIEREYKHHDALIQALAVHYHFAAMHPFLDGNGRTARALEAFMLKKAGLRDTVFIAMSNYYYDEKESYLKALSAVRAQENDLTAFLLFGLRGIKVQSDRVRAEITVHIKKSIYRNLMYDLFNRLETKRKRVVAERQLEILKFLLQHGETRFGNLIRAVEPKYASLKAWRKVIVQDLGNLLSLGAIHVTKDKDTQWIAANLDWPTLMTESGFMDKLASLPKAKSFSVFST